MGKLRYIASRLRRMNSSAVPALVKKVADRSAKSKPAILFDMLRCGLVYQAGFTDYELFAMERANAEQRRTYVTRGINDRLVKQFNDASYRHIFVNKDEFNEKFSDFLKRDWMKVVYPTDEGCDISARTKKLAEFCDGKDEIVLKPRDGMCGKGVEMIRPADFADMSELYKYACDASAGVIEEIIVQHPKMCELYPDSINTLRIVTVNNHGDISVVIALCRVGNGGRIDNFLSGGMMTRVSVETGEMLFDAVDSQNVVFERHPITGTVFKGFKIPMWDECVELAKAAAAVVPQVGYVGWDVAVTPTGAVLVEGNEFPGHCLYQLPPHTPDNYGVLPLFEKAAGGKIL